MSMPIGVGVVIDDQLDSDTDGIQNIVSQLENKGFPLVKYSQLPSETTIAQFGSVAFLLLDWNLINPPPAAVEQGVHLGETLKDIGVEENLSFIERFHNTCFAPIFIFTNEKTRPIKRQLKKRKLFFNNEKDFILLMSKADLKSTENNDTVVESVINMWIKKSPVIHIIDEWNRGLFRAQNKMFNDFYDGSHSWPTLLWKTFLDDGSDPRREMISMISKNLFARFDISLDEKIIEQGHAQQPTIEEATSFLEKVITIPHASLELRHGSGDIFHRRVASPQKGESFPYLLNISCDCDFARNPDSLVVFLPGKIVSGKKAVDSDGKIKRSLGKAYVYPISKGKFVCFDFSQHIIMKLSKLKLSKRVCRLTPPYLTDIRQRYAHWMQREGLPAMPKQTRS